MIKPRHQLVFDVSGGLNPKSLIQRQDTLPVKLIGIHYLAWTHAVNILLYWQQFKYLNDNPTKTGDSNYENMMSENSIVMRLK